MTCLREEGLLNDTPKTELKLETTTAQGRALVLAEHEGGRLHPSVRHAVGAARCLANEVVLLVVGEAVLAIEAATLAGVSRVLHVDVAHFAQTLAEDHAPLLAQAARDLQVDTVLAAATPFGKALLPRAAALLDSAMLSDVVQILAPDRFVRPIHAGEALATIRDTQPLRIMSVRPAAFAPVADQAAVSIESLATPAPAGKACWLSTSQPERNRPALADARIVIAGGRGLGSAAQFRALIEPLADRLNAAIGATRAAVDAGFIGNDHQIGQTGAIVAPEFYFAIGLSGAAQHLAGMRDSRVIVAINSDPAAPICRHADYVLEGDLQRILPELLALLEK
ncbi:electron transfer flavoprotein subunit alpha/FixB family protein [Formivibrio citricus]|uniref:electron transfer flavoprotein subunit alpha/FixB family protein n=1 Tax=Formivibrio citricus TaxID=83765 RepID=UPI001FE02D3A|nr:FAD-binding protein [Formivibrio citricus]